MSKKKAPVRKPARPGKGGSFLRDGNKFEPIGGSADTPETVDTPEIVDTPDPVEPATEGATTAKGAK